MDDDADVHVDVEGVRGAEGDGFEICVEFVSARAVVRPVEENLGGGNNIHLHDSRVERVLSGLERIGPDAFASVLNDFRVHSVVGQVGSLRPDVAGDHAAEADVDANHGRFFNGGEPRVDCVVSGAKDGYLETFLAASLQKRGRILEVVVRIVRELFCGDFCGVRDWASFEDGNDADLIRFNVGPVGDGNESEEERVQAVAAGHEDFELPAFFATVLNKGLTVEEVIVSVHFSGEEASVGNPGSVGSFDEADFAAGDLRDGELHHVEEDGVDAVETGQQEGDLGTAFAAVTDERVGVLKAIAVDGGAEVAAGAGDGFTGDGFDASDFVLADHDCVDDFDLKEVGVDAVLSFGEDLELRTFFAAVSEKGFTVLKEVAFDGARHEEAGGDGVAGDGADDADLVLGNFEEGAFAGAVDEGDEEMDAGSENAGLDTDFVSQCDGATIGHVGTEPATLEEDDLVASRDGDGAVDEVEAEEDEGGEGGVTDDEVE